MNVRLLKAKRVEHNVKQKDLAAVLGITEKAMCQKECSEVNKFKAEEMVEIVKALNLSFPEFDAIYIYTSFYNFDAIFFDHELTKCLRLNIKT